MVKTKNAAYNKTECFQSLSLAYDHIHSLANKIHQLKPAELRHTNINPASQRAVGILLNQKNPDEVVNFLKGEDVNQAKADFRNEAFLKKDCSLEDFLAALKTFAGGFSSDFITHYTDLNSGLTIPELQDFIVVFEWLDNVISEANHLYQANPNDPFTYIEIKNHASKLRDEIASTVTAIVEEIKKPLIDLFEFTYTIANDSDKHSVFNPIQEAESTTLEQLGFSQSDIKRIKSVFSRPSQEELLKSASPKVKKTYEDFKLAITQVAFGEAYDILLKGIPSTPALREQLRVLLSEMKPLNDLTIPQFILDSTNIENEQKALKLIREMNDLGVDFGVLNKEHQNTLHYLKPSNFHIATFFRHIHPELWDILDINRQTPMELLAQRNHAESLDQ